VQKKNLKNQLENDLALLLLEKLYEEELSFEKAQEIAKFILKAIPENVSERELEKILPTLDDKFSELCPVVLKYLRKKEEIKTNREIEKIKKVLKGKNG